MTIKFFTKQTKEQNSKSKIFCRVTINRKKTEFVTDFQVIDTDWDPLKQRSKTNFSLNRGLLKIESTLYDIRQSQIDEGKELTTGRIVDLLTGRSDKRSKIEIIDYFESYVEDIKKKQELSISNIKHNSGTCKILKVFLDKIKKPNLQIMHVDYAFLKEFDNYLMTDYRSPLGQSIQRNTVNHHHRRLRVIINRAIKDGIIHNSPYNSFKLKNTKTDRTYLTEEEINAIVDLDLGNNQSLDRVRDIFLFACNTGVRWSDSSILTHRNIELYEGKKYLRFQMRKTQDPVAVPLTQDALKIIEKYKAEKDFAKDDKLLPKISGQKFNNYIKHVAELAGLYKTVTHHVAKHTFATVALLNGIPIHVVQKILGHTKVETTQIYAKTLPKTLFAEMEKFKL